MAPAASHVDGLGLLHSGPPQITDLFCFLSSPYICNLYTVFLFFINHLSLLSYLFCASGGGATGGAALSRDPQLVLGPVEELRPQCGEDFITGHINRKTLLSSGDLRQTLSVRRSVTQYL